MHYNYLSSSGSPAPIRPDIFLLSGSDVGIGSRLLAGSTTGAMAVAFAQPTDVVKVRFQAQIRCHGHARRYCSTVDAYKSIAKEEGIRGLWKGSLRGLFSSKKYPLISYDCFFFFYFYFTLSCRYSSEHCAKCNC